MNVIIQQWGNSAAIRLPATALKRMSLKSGDVLSLDVSTDTITLKAAKTKPHYLLANLLAQCDLSAPEPADLAAWDGIQPVGREV